MTETEPKKGEPVQLNEYVDLPLDKIVEWVEAQYAARRTTAISNEEMLEQVRAHLAEYF